MNCTFTDNNGTTAGGFVLQLLGTPAQVAINNSIVWGNTGDQIIDGSSGGDREVNFSNVEGGWGGSGSNNIDADPLFVEPTLLTSWPKKAIMIRMKLA